MSSSLHQGNPGSPAAPSFASSGIPELTIDGHRILSQPERTIRNVAANDDQETSNASDARSVSSGRSSKVGVRKRLSRLFKGDNKVKESSPSSGVASIPVAIAVPEQYVQFAAPDSSAAPSSLRSNPPGHASQTPSTTLTVPVAQMQPNPAANIRLDIFPKNVAKPTHKTDLPKPHARVDKTPQLVYAY
ncbi:hypothetical protein BGZ97_005519, partial [Linnemannia gamsii]